MSHHIMYRLLFSESNILSSYHLLSALPTECSLSYSTAYTCLLLTAPATTRDPRTCSLAETSCMCLCPYLNGRLLLIVLCHSRTTERAQLLLLLIILCHWDSRMIERVYFPSSSSSCVIDTGERLSGYLHSFLIDLSATERTEHHATRVLESLPLAISSEVEPLND